VKSNAIQGDIGVTAWAMRTESDYMVDLDECDVMRTERERHTSR